MAGSGAEHGVIPVFFLSDSTGISAETMGNALLIQFPELQFDRTLIPVESDKKNTGMTPCSAPLPAMTRP